MADRVVLITGAARGIGAAIATRLAADGWRTVVADRDPAPDAPHRAVQTDVADEAQVNALLADIQAREGRLDGLVCNAGFMIRKPLRELTLAEWNSVLATNLTSSFLLVRAAEAMLRVLPSLPCKNCSKVPAHWTPLNLPFANSKTSNCLTPDTVRF